MRKSLLLFMFGFIFHPIFSQDIDQKRTSSHAVGVGNETLSLISNYPGPLFYLDYTFKDDYVLALGFGPVLNSESFLLEGVTNKFSYNSFLEFKWYPFSETTWFKPFVGLGYGYLKSNFETEYIVLTGESPHTYFVNHAVKLQTTIKTVYVPIGIRVYVVEDILYFEPSIRLQYIDKSVDWSEQIIAGDVKSNQNISRDLTEYRSPIDPFFLDGGILQNYADNFMFSIKFGFKFSAF